jgi:DNA-binding HxlR family transcriptional regulator
VSIAKLSDSVLIRDEECTRVSRTLELIGKRWSSAILLALARDATRFGEIRNIVDGLSDRMLVVRLKELERAGLVARSVEPTTPVSVRYTLTERGRELIAAFDPLVRYSQRWETPRHDPTGPAESDAG